MRAAPTVGSTPPRRKGPQLPEKTLFSAAATGKLDDVTRLIQSGAEVNDKDEYDITSLHYAARYEHTAVVKCLTTNGANLKSRDKWGRTPLQVAESRGDRATVDALKEAEVLNTADELGYTPLHYAAESGKPDIVKVLIKVGADVDAKDKDGDTPLHITAFNGYTAIAKALLEAGAEVNAKNNYGRTPLHVAAQLGRLETVEALLEAGADPTVTDGDGETPLDVATNDAIKALLQEAGA